jgi:hypothetical protein
MLRDALHELLVPVGELCNLCELSAYDGDCAYCCLLESIRI